MAVEQKRNIQLGGCGKGMSLGLRPRDIPMPYPSSALLRFFHEPRDLAIVFRVLAHTKLL